MPWVLVVGVGLLVWHLSQRARPPLSPPDRTPYNPFDPWPGPGSENPPIQGPSAWLLPPAGQPYAVALTQAETRYGLPRGLLGRVAWQESRFRPDIIEGRTVSPAGALGLMQIIPRWHPDVDPLDPFAAIDYAGYYIRQLQRQFGTWDKALAAYNWGPGNLATAIDAHGAQWAQALPGETARYIDEISTDLNLVG